MPIRPQLARVYAASRVVEGEDVNNPDERMRSAPSGAVTFQGYLRILREQRRVTVGVLLLAAIASILVAILQPPEYTARLTLYAAAQPGSESSALQAGELAQQRVASYKELVTSNRVTGEIVDRLNLDASPSEIAQRLTAASPPDSVLIKLGVTGPSPEEAAAVANTLGAIMTDLVAELEAPKAAPAPPPVSIRVVDPASAPSSPSSPDLVVTLTFGMLAGLVLAAGTALARNALDTSVKSAEQLREASGVRVLGTIEFDRQVRQRPLIVQRDPRAQLVETFRQLRTKLQFPGTGADSKVYLVTSPLPLEGKTTTVCNLAIALGSGGTRTLVVEADLRQPRLAELVGLDPSVGLTSVVTGNSTARCAIQPWPAGHIDILTSGPIPANPDELLAATDLASLLSTLRSHYDVILIDTPPVLPVSDTLSMAPRADGTILLCRHRKTRQENVRATIDALDAVSAPVFGAVLTMAPRTQTRNYPRSATRRRNLGLRPRMRDVATTGISNPMRAAVSAIRFVTSQTPSRTRTRRM